MINILLFGATGMVGQGVLRECLLDEDVREILAVGRSKTEHTHPKLRQLVHGDLLDVAPIASQLIGFEACFFCLGVSSVGLGAEDYRRVTYDLTTQIAEVLARENPGMTFIYVSGEGTDGSEQGRLRWARVKGATENALRRMPFKAAVMFRPGVIIPRHGIVSKTWLYRAGYALLRPLGPWLFRTFPRHITTTEQLGRAMLRVAKDGAPQPILENREINTL